MRETDSYELLDGRRIPGLHRDDVISAFLTFLTYEPRMLRPGIDEEGLDAMARALGAAIASRERREAEDRAHERRRIEAAAQSRALLETNCRVRAHVAPACPTCRRIPDTPAERRTGLCAGCGGYLWLAERCS